MHNGTPSPAALPPLKAPALDTRIDLINKILQDVSVMYREFKVTTPEQALIAVSLLQAMENFGQDTRTDYPRKMAIQTPRGSLIKFEILKPADKPIDISKVNLGPFKL